jgi:hypothetical protein
LGLRWLEDGVTIGGGVVADSSGGTDTDGWGLGAFVADGSVAVGGG